jgi:DNA-directed RNA polymerase subunit RPC12/RpoP
MNSSYDSRERQFMEYLRDGITAAKTGQRKLAESLLNRAIYLDGSDARPYLWLTSITDDPNQQIEYLEKAVALDPANASARRGLAILRGKIDQSKLLPETVPEWASESVKAGAALNTVAPAHEIEVEGDAFLCPSCGGRMSFSMLSGQLTCEYCGHYEEAPGTDSEGQETLYSSSDRAEQVLDFVMPTTVGHAWAQAQQHLCCERCGAHSLLPAGQKTNQCPYCGSNQIVKTSTAEELMAPQLIAVMKYDEKEAVRLAHKWLGKGLLSPDNLISSSSSMKLRPGYYSFWTFDGTVEVRWSCELAEGDGNYKHWEPVNGVETRFFNDVLVPGVKAIKLQELDSLKPFDLENLETFEPGYLAGWPAVLYDRSLSDASLVARDEVIRDLRPQMYSLIEPGREKRNVNIGGSQWSGMTFKHLLLPLWIGDYTFQGKSYRVLVNGQIGKVTGEKPRDSVKIVFLAMMGLMVVVVLVLLYLIFGAPNATF